MTEKERLIKQIFRKLELLENKSNQSKIKEIKGLLYNLLEFEV